VNSSHSTAANRERERQRILNERIRPGMAVVTAGHLISIPAGFGRMNLKKFITYTLIGATAWSAILTYSGILLGANYEQVREFTSQFDIYILLALLALIIWFVWRHLKK